jgi:chemotaxis protein methyltransferase CheR
MPDLTHIRFEGAPGPPSSPARRTPLSSRRPDEPPLRPFLAWILRSCGASPDAYLPSALARRMSACLRGAQAATDAVARERLEADPRRLEEMLDILLIGVTDFFRDPFVFEALEARALPELLASRERVRVLSAGCSDGRELYSLAIALAARGALERGEFTGIDLRRSALRRAAEGRFPRPEGVDLRRFAGLFREEGDTLLSAPALRERFRWRRANLLEYSEEETYDVILCRNLAIYLRQDAGSALWASLAARLSPGGVLVTGKAEAPPPGLFLRRIGPCLYQREAS